MVLETEILFARGFCTTCAAELTPGRTYRNKTTDGGVSAQVDLDVGAATLTSITAYRQYKAGGAADIDYNFADITYRDDDGNSFRQFKTFTQELRLQGSAFEDRLDFLVGGYYSNEKLKLVRKLRERRGFSFVGSTILYAHMQAVGMVNDHLVGCFRHRQVSGRQSPRA